MKKGILALLAFVLGIHAGFGCGSARATAAIEAPCCGANCPVPSAGHSACCQAQNPGAAAQAVSAKANRPSFQPLADSIHPRVVMAELIGIERVSIFQNSPPGAMKLALLCSRQI